MGDKMQINRLFEIVYILLDKDKTTAKELSEHFEVSTRTIYRDIEILASSGLPIYMSKGKGGGISLLPGFVLNKTMLTEKEKGNIISALQSLNAVDALSVEDTLSKLSFLFGQNNSSWIEIDYSDWGNIIKEQFEASKKAILSRKLLTFSYISSKGEVTVRKVEPINLWFKERNWYLKGYCLDKEGLRIFRLSRMRNVVCTEEGYIPRSDINRNIPWENVGHSKRTKIIAKIAAHQMYRVYDEFREKDITKNSDGSFAVTMNFIEDQWVYGYILSFGSSIEVLEPMSVRNVIREKLKESLVKYL